MVFIFTFVTYKNYINILKHETLNFSFLLGCFYESAVCGWLFFMIFLFVWLSHYFLRIIEHVDIIDFFISRNTLGLISEGNVYSF